MSHCRSFPWGFSRRGSKFQLVSGIVGGKKERLSIYSPRLSTWMYEIIWLKAHSQEKKYTCLLIFHVTRKGASQVVKNLPVGAGDARDVGSVPGSGRSPGVGSDNPLQYSCWDNPMDRGACRATVHGVAKSQTRVCTYLWSSQVRKSEYSKIYWAMSLYTILVGKMENYGRLWGESKWSLGKMNKPFKEWVGDMTAFDKVCLGVVSTFILLPCDESVHPDWWNSRVGDSWQLSFFWWLCL